MSKGSTVSINHIIKQLRTKLADVNFDDIGNSLMSLHDKYIMATGYRRVDDDIIDVDIFCNDEYRTYYIVTLRRIVNYQTIPQEYITINKTTTMADNVEVYCSDSMMNSDIIKDSYDNYILEQPICIEDIDMQELAESITDMGVHYLIIDILDSIKDTDTKLDVLKAIKEYYTE